MQFHGGCDNSVKPLTTSADSPISININFYPEFKAWLSAAMDEAEDPSDICVEWDGSDLDKEREWTTNWYSASGVYTFGWDTTSDLVYFPNWKNCTIFAPPFTSNKNNSSDYDYNELPKYAGAAIPNIKGQFPGVGQFYVTPDTTSHFYSVTDQVWYASGDTVQTPGYGFWQTYKGRAGTMPSFVRWKSDGTPLMEGDEIGTYENNANATLTWTTETGSQVSDPRDAGKFTNLAWITGPFSIKPVPTFYLPGTISSKANLNPYQYGATQMVYCKYVDNGSTPPPSAIPSKIPKLAATLSQPFGINLGYYNTQTEADDTFVFNPHDVSTVYTDGCESVYPNRIYMNWYIYIGEQIKNEE